MNPEKLFRREVLATVESLRKRPCDASETQYLLREPFVSPHMHLVRRRGMCPAFWQHYSLPIKEPLEFVCDFVESHSDGYDDIFSTQWEVNEAAVRGLWHVLACWTPSPSAGRKESKDKDDDFDVYRERHATVTGVDIRDMRNVPMVAAALRMFLRESCDAFFPEMNYQLFMRGGQSDFLAVVKLVVSAAPREAHMLHRVLSMLVGIARRSLPGRFDETLRKLCLREAGLGAAIIRGAQCGADNDASDDFRGAALLTMLLNLAKLFPRPYEGSVTRVPQCLHYQSELLRVNEIAVLTGSGEEVVVAAEQTVLDEHAENIHFYRVVDGRLDVLVGVTKVGTLVSGDWFGEMSLLSSTFTRARVVARKRSRIVRVHHDALNATLRWRPDLAAKFYAILAFDLATRLNVALVQSSNCLPRDVRDVSVDPLQARAVLQTRAQGAKESNFRFNAETHAVRAFAADRIGRASRPHPATLYVFHSQVASLYQKGCGEQKTVVPIRDVLSVEEHPCATGGVIVDITYSVRKRRKIVSHKFMDCLVKQEFMEVLSGLLQGFKKDPASFPPLPAWGLMRAIAMYDLRRHLHMTQEYLVLERGARYTILDRVGDWFYGFCDSDTKRKGLFPVSFVELRPHGVLLEDVLLPTHWKAIADRFVVHELKQGDFIIKTGDPLASGHLWFIERGELCVTRSRRDMTCELLATVGQGETLGELVLLLGGCSRASVQVTSKTARVLQLPRDRLVALLSNDTVFGGRFWKFVCATLVSRLGAMQQRYASQPPSLPPIIPFEVSAEQRAKAEAFGSSPSLPVLDDSGRPHEPEVARDADEAAERLRAKLKLQGGFFLGVDAPALVESSELIPFEDAIEAEMAKKNSSTK